MITKDSDSGISHAPGLRERKAAHTKVALMNAFLEQLETKAMDEIAVKAVCEIIPVSEVTFYNYFPRKTDIISFHLRLWSVQAQWGCARARLRGLEAVRHLYRTMAEGVERRPHLMNEAVSFFSWNGEATLSPLTSAEVMAAFPDLDGVGAFRSVPIPALLRERFEEARELGELPSSLDVDRWLPAALTIFFGAPLAMGWTGGKSLATEYSRQLDVLLESMSRDERRR
jgi:AcrR family transcriptional regulator